MRTRDEQKERVIRQKALEMIVRYGIDRFSIQKLARVARVSPATIYIYFKNRDDLIVQLYADVTTRMFEYTLRGFDSSMPFAEGLRIQWENRVEFALSNHTEALFLEHLRCCPLHHKAQQRVDPRYRAIMLAFVHNAIRNKQLVKISLEVFWSVAYAPLYNLIRMHRSGVNLSGEKFVLDKKVMNKTLELVLKSLQPSIKTP